MSDTILIGRPSVVTSNWKSTATLGLAHPNHSRWRGGRIATFVLASARSQSRRVASGSSGCGGNGFVALGGAVLPGDAAGEPFADRFPARAVGFVGLSAQTS